MLSYEELKPVVEGVARQYSKDLITGKGFSYQTYQDLSQELWLKAYEIIGDYPNAPIEFVSKCLWNKATDSFRSDMKKVTTESLHDTSDFSVERSLDSSKKLREAIVEKSEMINERFDDEIEELVNAILNYAKKEDRKIYTYVVVKLKMFGYIDESYEPEMSMSKFEKSHPELDCSQDQYILKELLGFSDKCSKTGGSGSFKGKKQEFRKLILNILDVEDMYQTWYEVTYLQTNGVVNSKWIKGYSEIDVKRIANNSIKNLDKIISIIGE